MSNDSVAVEVIRRLGVLKGLRSKHEQTWRDCYDYSFPIRSQGFNGDTEEISGVQAKKAELCDTTSTDSGRQLASAIQTGITPANSRWFGMTVWNETDDEKTWLDESADSLWKAIHASNFDADSFECMLDIVAAGWFVLFVDENRADDGSVNGLRFEQWPTSQCYCAASQPGGPIDSVYRPYTLTVEQCVAEFGESKVSDKVRKLYQDEKLDEPVQLVHAIYPRRNGQAGARRAKNMPFASVHIDCDGKTTLRESGYHERPFTAPRWTLIPQSVYAIGPMFDALPDVKMLNTLARMELANVDMAVSGMFVAVDDGVLNPCTIKVGPRKIIVANSVDSIKALPTAADFNVSFTKREQLQGQIRKTLMADQLPPLEGSPRTATEFHVRVNLIRQLLGPVYGRLQAEYLQPLIERCFGLAFRGGLFGQPPQSLAGRPYTVIYLSPMAKSQKMEEVSAIEGALASVAALAQEKGDPTVWDSFDVDESARVAADGRGMPAKLIRSPEQVAAIRQRRQEIEQEQQQQAMQQQIGMEAATASVQRMAAAQ
ncbi:portal protein [Achromobacter sp. 2789STDY5608628]|uniref:portal protein n=1 Tax=Achromobacter sp. 2789STDY5608628 TaxID=1806493 RepID=UPI0006C6A6F1|nr:portal protein [Achromobacter sp. 2789STDY5608628]CUJ67547.1 Bacteriophage head to tail connecting protein [Achromobacter sp. 2789STDY5608628]